jgi:alanine racemase
MGGCMTHAELSQAVELDLEIVIHEAAHFELLSDFDTDKPIRAWLKLDTGMGRLGFAPDKFSTCMSFLANLECIEKPVRLMTHLACADELNNPMTAEQIRRFGQAIGVFEGDISIANSAAVLSWPQSLEPSPELDYRGDNWIRPGVALYGASPIAGKNARELGLKPAMTFESRLIAVKTIPEGGYVGYGSTWQAERETAIGVIAVGYGDGYPRQMPEGTPVLINDRRAALIGRVSMDMITVDLTDIPVARVGDRAVLWGEQLPIEEIAARAGTISYELMSGLTGRVERQYKNGPD